MGERDDRDHRDDRDGLCAETTVTGLWAILGDLRAFSEKALRRLGSLGGLGCLDLALDTKCCVPIE